MQVKEAKSPVDYTFMYTAGESCMSIAACNCTTMAWLLYKKTGLWLSSTYAYMPGIVGLYCTDDYEMPTARLVGVNEEFPAIYSDDRDSAHILFRYAMRKKHMNWKFKMRPSFPDFEVPGLQLGTEHYCFVPKFDFYSPFCITYDEETKSFKWVQTYNRWAYLLLDGHKPDGVISATEVLAKMEHN